MQAVSVSKGEPLQSILLDVSGASHMDTTAAEAVKEWREGYERTGVRLALTDPNSQISMTLQKTGMLDSGGSCSIMVNMWPSLSSELFQLFNIVGLLLLFSCVTAFLLGNPITPLPYQLPHVLPSPLPPFPLQCPKALQPHPPLPPTILSRPLAAMQQTPCHVCV